MSELIPTIVYTLCFVTSSLCAWLLTRSYRRSRSRMLLWSAACFIFLAANNFVVIIDMMFVGSVDLRFYRLLFSAAAVSVLLFGFVWDLQEDQE